MATTLGERSGSLRNQVRYIYLLSKTTQLLSIAHFCTLLSTDTGSTMHFTYCNEIWGKYGYHVRHGLCI